VEVTGASAHNRTAQVGNQTKCGFAALLLFPEFAVLKIPTTLHINSKLIPVIKALFAGACVALRALQHS